MIISPLSIAGAYLVEPTRREDERGTFERAFCAEEFGRAGLPTGIAQINVSRNRRAGTLRGVHWQAEPFPETKVVRAIKGAIYDVLVDVRPTSMSFGAWTAVELSAADGRAVFVPAGVAHGFQTLVDDVDVLYLMGAPYAAEAARGIRYDDPDVGIAWPLPVSVVSSRDLAFGPLR